MLKICTKPPVGQSLRVGLVFLAAAIFTWGLQAKLALYQPPSPTRAISVAKLAQDKQQRLSISQDQQSASHRLPAFASCLLLALVLDRSAGPRIGSDLRVGRPISPSTFLFSPPLFGRPPPTYSAAAFL